MFFYRPGFGLSQPYSSSQWHSLRLSPKKCHFIEQAFTTDSFSSIGPMVRNCAATALANAILFMDMDEMGRNQKLQYADRTTLLSLLYRRIGNGPILPSTCRKQLPICSYEYLGKEFELLPIPKRECTSYLTGDNMVLILAAEHLFSMHYLSAIGVMNDELLVFDGWTSASVRRFNPHQTFFLRAYLIQEKNRSK